MREIICLALLGACVALAPSAAADELDLSTPHAPDLPGRPAQDAASAGSKAGTAAKTESRRKLRKRLAALTRSAPSPTGVFVADIRKAGRQKVFAESASKRLKLASNMKLFTTSAALGRFGADGTLTTRVVSDAEISERGFLAGDAYVVGAGDPSLGSAGMAELAQEVEEAGVTRIKGDLLGDDSVFDRRRGVPDSGYAPSPYIAPLSGLTYGGSTYSTDPALAATRALRDALRERGVKVKGEVGVETATRAGMRPLADRESPPVSELVRATNFPSNNFFAEMLLKAIDAADGDEGTTAGGAAEVERFARGSGARVEALDGSGLTDGNRASARSVVELLDAMDESENARAFYRSLPRAGREGTLDERMRGTRAENRCRGKTGTIFGVSTLSGYCNSGRGGRLAFSILMNGVSSTTYARSLQDRMVIELAGYRP